DEELGRYRLAGVRGDRPAAGALVEAGRGDLGVELDVGGQPEAIGHVLQVRADLRRLRVPLTPLPLLPQFLVEGVAVDVAVGVAAGPRVAVPVPGPPDVAAGLKDPDGQAQIVPELVQHVQAGEAGPDHDRVEFAGLPVVAHRHVTSHCLFRARCHEGEGVALTKWGRAFN